MINQILFTLDNETSVQSIVQSHMTMRAYRLGGIEGTLHAVALVLNIDLNNESFRLDVFDSNGEFRKLYSKTTNEFVCCVKDITGLLNGFELMRPSLGISESLLHESRMKTVSWFRKFILENKNSALAHFGLVDICVKTITLNEINKLVTRRYSNEELKDKLKNSYVELNFLNYNGLAFMVENYSDRRGKYFILTRKEKKVRDGQNNPISDFIEIRQYEVFMDIFVQILNKKIDEVLRSKNIILKSEVPNTICNMEVCNEGINIRGSGCNTWVLFYHWLRINHPNNVCNDILKKIVNLESANVSSFEKNIYNILEKQSKNYDTNLVNLMKEYLFSKTIKIENVNYLKMAEDSKCLFGGSLKKIKKVKKIEKKKKKSLNNKNKKSK